MESPPFLLDVKAKARISMVSEREYKAPGKASNSTCRNPIFLLEISGKSGSSV